MIDAAAGTPTDLRYIIHIILRLHYKQPSFLTTAQQGHTRQGRVAHVTPLDQLL